ncbi:MAG: tRNA uridine-5-carboxymethylaminomethyl(34) synthesis GTPase MnmE [Bacilli bacterium]|nr:tRNA uridine-5-carboxymethylaminomethyl(34) synthesis GTPase MnmE [Bacilli bacterium]
MDDTIVAISTALGVGAISIVRMSGNNCIEIANKVFKGTDLTKVDSHTIHYGKIVVDEEIIDEVLVTIMKSPKTYTTENIVEINCHGGISTTKKIVEILLLNGARLAEKGEFTKRAFLNGRIDLTQSEAVMDLIESKTNKERNLAINNLQGNLLKKIEKLRNEIKDLISHIEVNIDYPEYYDIEIMTEEKTKKIVEKQIKELKELIKESEDHEIIKTGIKTIIIGRPNVGKSSILNSLLEYEKAIVTDIEGTTRDIVEGNISLEGIALNIIDTAGIRKTEDKVEKIGVNKSLSLIEEADLILVVLNGNEKLTKEDKEIIEKTKEKTSIIVINKNDLPKNIETEKLSNRITIETNTTTANGINPLKEKIKELFNLDKIESKKNTYLTNTRQISLAKKSLKSLEEAKKSLEKEEVLDMVEIDLKEAFDNLGKIIGIDYSDEIIDNLFQNFCVGK